jgi:hypothetical protein
MDLIGNEPGRRRVWPIAYCPTYAEAETVARSLNKSDQPRERPVKVNVTALAKDTKFRSNGSYAKYSRQMNSSSWNSRTWSVGRVRNLRVRGKRPFLQHGANAPPLLEKTDHP